MHIWQIQVIGEVSVGEWVWRQFPHVVLVTSTVDIVEILDLGVAEVIRAGTHRVDSSLVALYGSVVAVTRAIHVVVPLSFDCVVVRVIVIGIARVNRVVVVSLVLDKRIEPSVSNKHILQLNLVCARDVLCVLLEEVGIENGSVVASIALSCEAEAVARILRERTHKTLQCLPHAWRRTLGAVGSQSVVWLGVCSACSVCLRVVWASRVWQLNDGATV